MIGLIVYGTIFLVSIICIIIFVQAIKYAKRNKKSTLKYGSVTSIILFFLVTWDWLPSEIYYAYQCAQLPPLQVYKTPEQWVSENQDLMSGKNVTFKINSEKDLPQVSEEGYPLTFSTMNGWFVYTYYETENNKFLRTYFSRSQLLNRKTGDILMEGLFFVKVQRFFAPPHLGHMVHCSISMKEEKKYAQIKRQFGEINMEPTDTIKKIRNIK